MRRVRQEMDAVAREQGRRRIEVSACVQGLAAENELFGVDCATWAREGLIDALIPYSAAPLAMPTDEDTWATAEQLMPFVEATRGTACTLAPNVMPRHMSPEDFRRKAHMIYGAGPSISSSGIAPVPVAAPICDRCGTRCDGWVTAMRSPPGWPPASPRWATGRCRCTAWAVGT